MTDLYIHIGTHKAGSTAIQSALRSWGNAGAEEGYTILTVPGELYSKLKWASEYSHDVVRKLRQQLVDAKRSRSSSYVLSNGHLSGSPEDGYANAGFVAAMLREATEGFNVKIILYLRRQDTFVESMYVQMVKQGMSDRFDKYIGSMPGGGQ